MTILEFTSSPIPHGNETWTDERITELKHRRFKLKESCGYIAKEMGLSRSSIIGKINRLGLSEPRAEKATKPVPLVSLRPAVPSGRKRAKPAGEARSKPAPPFREMGATEATDIAVEFVSENPVRLVDAGKRECRWPLGNPSSEMLVCGGRTRDKYTPYCTAHCLIAYVPSRSIPREPLIAGRGRG